MSNQQEILDDDLNKYIKEDPNEDGDDFENIANIQIALHKKQLEEKENNNRPESKHIRPESSKIKQQNKSDDQKEYLLKEEIQKYQQNNSNTIDQENYDFRQSDKKQDDYDSDQEEQNPAIQRLAKYINFHCINIENFWKSNKVRVTLEEFKKYLYAISFETNQDEIEQLFLEFMNDDGYICIETVCKKIDPWKNNADFMIDFIRQKALKVAQESQKKYNQQHRAISAKANGIRPISSNQFITRPISGYTSKTFQTKQSGQTELKSHIPQNRSNYYLKKHKEKEMEVERLLQLTINRGKNEYEYECLIKMGEANELSQSLLSKITYRAYKSADGNLKVHVYELDKFVKELTLDEFQREYNIIKNQYNQNKNLKIWEQLSENKKSSNYQSRRQMDSLKAGDDDMQSKTINKKERQGELKQVLLETMMLTNILKEQLQILNKKGINGSYGGNKINANSSIQPH